jgi:hypothetical protein
MAVLGSVWSLRWSNPYTTPPDGMPRVRAEVFFPVGHPNYGWGGCPAELSDLHVLGSGWVIAWCAVDAPIKPLSQQALGAVRRKRLARSVRAKYPLLAEQIIEEELAKRPHYYAGVTDAEIAARRAEVMQQLAARLQPLIETPGVIHWYDTEA